MNSIIQVLKIVKNQVTKLRDFANSPKQRWLYWHTKVIPFFIREKKYSELPLTIMIPVAEKDAPMLRYCIEGIRRNLRHPITQILIVAPNSELMVTTAQSLECSFIDENDILDFNTENIELKVAGVDRSKWIYQQFLKLSGDTISKDENYLVIDSDTVLVRPQVYEVRGRIVYNFSDEYHVPYFEAIKKLLGFAVKCPVSFTSHQMVFSKKILQNLKLELERRFEGNWRHAILNQLNYSELSAHSDYETYGQFMYKKKRGRLIFQYWRNLSLTRDFCEDLDILEKKYGADYKSISFHSWNK